MQNTATMNSDIKALLTLLLLKTGTSSQEISHALQLASASRMMMQEEYASPARTLIDHAVGNVAKLRPAGSAETATARRMRQNADSMNSDIKALLTFLLLKNGAGSNEIQTALRMSAASRVAAAEDAARSDAADAENDTTSEAPTPLPSARQSLRNDQLSPVSNREVAA